jgi:glutamine amidotransferase
MIIIVDYGLANLRSLSAALERLTVPFACSASPTTISRASGLILPGVGAFPDGMRNLKRLGLIEVLNELVLVKKKPVLGICLGFHLMASRGEEFEMTDGLGWIPAQVVKMKATSGQVKVPHVGWNDCVLNNESPIFNDMQNNELFYFTHSYYMKCNDPSTAIAVTEHGDQFVSAIQHENIFGTQFHPEKSQLAGLTVLKNFANNVALSC